MQWRIKLWPQDPETNESTGLWCGQPDWQSCGWEPVPQTKRLAIISIAGQSDTLRWGKRPQSISNACNEKHIFLYQWKDNQQLNRRVNRSSLQESSETNNTNLYQPPQLHSWILKQGYLQTCRPLTQLLAVVSISECVPAVFLCGLCKALIWICDMRLYRT